MNGKEEKILKNGTARFQNFDQFINADTNNDGNDDPDTEEKNKECQRSNDSCDNPLLEPNDSFDDMMNNTKREKGFSISDIPKIPIEKCKPNNDENYGYILNNDTIGISHSYDPNSSDLKDRKVDNNDSDLLSIHKSLDFNNLRLPFRIKPNDVNTCRESDYSWNQKSKLDNASETQDMIMDYLESERDGFNTDSGPQGRSEVKEEISTLRDKIFRSLEDYKTNVDKLS